MTGLTQRMADVAEAVTLELSRLIEPVPGPRGRVIEAMRYAALGGGKRLRPFLVVASADLFDVERARSLRTAAAVEMVHSYSLIHDDLPAMDDADIRRGRPSVHREFDEATAILAGDGLLTESFAVLAHPDTHPDANVRVRLVLELSAAAGVAGMVGGQMIDIAPERTGLDLAGIGELQRLKTGALIKFSCSAGAVLGAAEEWQIAALGAYADKLGLAFQIVDDLLDSEGSEAEIGKPTGQDESKDKATFVKLLGREGARRKARDLAEEAKSSLARFGARVSPLCDVAKFVVDRRS